jgi:hypothetical protein
MRSRPSLLIAGVVGLGLLGWALLGRTLASGPRELSSGEGSVVATTSDEVASESSTEEAALPTRAAAPNETSVSPALPSWDSPPDRTLDLHGLVTDASGVPVAGAEVTAFADLDREWRIPYQDAHRRSVNIGTVRTSAEGEFRIRVKPGGSYDLDARHADWVAERVLDRHAGEYVVIRLGEAAELHGEVTETGTNLPIADVIVQLLPPRGGQVLAECRTAPDGRFRFERLAPGKWGMILVPQRHEAPDWIALDLEPGAVVERSFMLNTGATLRGRVIEEGTQRPIPHAELSDSWSFRRVVKADAEGRFEASGLAISAEWSAIHARAEGYGQREFRALDLRVSGEIELALAPAYSVRGVLHLPNGAPAAGALVMAVTAISFAGINVPNSIAAVADAEGAFTLSNVRTDVQQVLCARSAGVSPLWRILQAPVQANATVDFGVLMFEVAGSLSGSLLLDDDAPALAAVECELRGPKGDSVDPRLLPTAELGIRFLVQRRRADDLGRFYFADLGAGGYELSITVPGRPKHRVSIDLTAGEQRVLVPVDLRGGRAIAGLVVDVAGSPVVGARVTILLDGARGTLGQLSLFTDAAGAFRFGGLEDAGYRLDVEAPVVRGAMQRFLPLAERVVHAGASELRLTLLEAGGIEGIVVGGATLQAALCEVRALSADGTKIATATADHAGAFRIRVHSGGALRLEFWPRKLLPGSEARGIRIQATDSPAVVLEGIADGARGLVVQL